MKRNTESDKRRQQIMSSDEMLPGDAQRAKGEETEDFDSLDTGNFGTHDNLPNAPDPQAREQINQTEEQLPGDAERAADERHFEEGEPPDSTLEETLPSRSVRAQRLREAAAREAGGTPLGGSASTHEPGLSGITGSADGTDTAGRAFGGSTTGYGEAESEQGGNSVTAPGGTEGKVNLIDEDDFAIPPNDEDDQRTQRR